MKKWITINEPWTVAVHGYDEGSKAPGHSNHFATEPYIVGHNLLLAHARAVFIYKSKFAQKQDGIIGISNSGDFRWPLNPDKKGDVDAADRSMEWQLGWFADPIWKGDYPPSMRKKLGHRLPSFTPEERKLLSGSSDFLGLNHYSSLLASEPLLQASSSGEYWADMHVEFSDHPSWTKNCMDGTLLRKEAVNFSFGFEIVSPTLQFTSQRMGRVRMRPTRSLQFMIMAGGII